MHPADDDAYPIGNALAFDSAKLLIGFMHSHGTRLGDSILDNEHCLAAFDVFVLPSFVESHSIALLEAMRAGKPIVATGVGGNTESVREGREAIIVPPVDSTALAEALSRLLGDSSAQERFRRAACQRFESEFRVDRMLRRTAEWLMACGAVARGEHAWPSAGRCQLP